VQVARIERSIRIDAPLEEVFDVLTDLDRLPDWATTVVENHDVPDGPLRPGQRFRQTVRVAGRNLESDWVVRSVDRPRQVGYEATAPGGGELRMIQRVTSDGDGSRVELELDYQLPGGLLGEAVDRAYVERRNEREAEHSLQNIKDLVEASGRG
jgi:uncharacterized membrane protein